MRLPKVRFKLRTVLAIVAVLAVVLSFAGPAKRRWNYCWMREEAYASFEAQYRAKASIPGSQYREEYLRLAERNRRYKWMWRREAFRFWEPPEMGETATLGK